MEQPIIGLLIVTSAVAVVHILKNLFAKPSIKSGKNVSEEQKILSILSENPKTYDSLEEQIEYLERRRTEILKGIDPEIVERMKDITFCCCELDRNFNN